MGLTMAVVSDDVRYGPAPTDVTDGGTLDIIGVFDQIWEEQPPCYAPQVCVSIGLSADATEFGQQVMVQVQLVDPEGTAIVTRQQQYTVPTPPPSGSRSFFYPVLPFRDVYFPSFGPYVFRVWVDGEHQIDLPIQASQLGGQS